MAHKIYKMFWRYYTFVQFLLYFVKAGENSRPQDKFFYEMYTIRTCMLSVVPKCPPHSDFCKGIKFSLATT